MKLLWAGSLVTVPVMVAPSAMSASADERYSTSPAIRAVGPIVRMVVATSTSPRTVPSTARRTERPRTSRFTVPSTRTDPPNRITSRPTEAPGSMTTEPAARKMSPPTLPWRLSAEAAPLTDPSTLPVDVMVTVPDEKVVRLPRTVPAIVTEPANTVRSPSIVPSTSDDTAVTY